MAGTQEADLLRGVASLLTDEVPTVSPAESVGTALGLLRRRKFKTVRDIAVLEGGELVGVVRIEDLLAAGDERPIGEIMDPNPPVIAPHVDREHAAWVATCHGESSLAVVGQDGSFSGIVAPERLVKALLEEHDQDMARFGGYLHSTRQARQAGLEPVSRRFLHRIPWLFVGLGGAIVAALLVGLMEEQLKSSVVIAFFIPGLVYLADAVGTQTEALVIRGLSVGIAIKSMFARELLTGILVGVVIAAAFFPLGILIWNEPREVLAVSIALFGACGSATIVAASLPGLFSRLGLDPAFGSGPLATVIQDLLSISIYLVVVLAIVK